MTNFMASVAILAVLLAPGLSLKVIMQGVEVEQFMEYTHVDYNRIANEFDLIDPSRISFAWEEEENSDNERRRGMQGSRRKAVEGLNPSADYSLEATTPDGSNAIVNREIVTVNVWSNQPNTSDWIGAYSPADVDITQTVPVRWAYANIGPNYMTEGWSNLTFNFTNLREDISFYYFTNGIADPVAVNTTLGKDPNLYFEDPNAPLRPRMTATGDYDVYRLLWSTNNSANPTLEWGVATGTYDNTVTATTSRLERDSMCGGKATGVGWRDTGAIHTALLSGMKALTAGSLIYYRFGDSVTDTWSDEFTFTVPPQPGTQPPNRPTTAILYCDLGRGAMDDAETWNAYGRPAYNTTRFAAARAQAGEVDAVFHGGDVSYATGYMAVWDFFMDQLSPLASRVLYLTTVGNHESDWPNTATIYNVTDSGGECGVATQTMLPMPEPATTNKPWWSYDVGIIHFVGLSTEHNYTACSEQYEWLEKDLASVDRTKTPWIILNGHRAMYISSTFNTSQYTWSDGSVQAALIKNIEPLLWKYQVNAGFYGHNHVYNRQAAVYKEIPIQYSEPRTIDGQTWNVYDNPQASVEIVIGNAGARFSNNSWPVNPDWCELVLNEYGYSVMTAVNDSYLEWVMYNTNENDEESVFDRIVITQDPSQLGKGWVNNNSSLDTSTAVCPNSNGGDEQPNSDNDFTRTDAFVILISLLAAGSCACACVYYYRAHIRGKSSHSTLNTGSDGSSDLEDRFRAKTGKSRVIHHDILADDTLRNPLTSDVQIQDERI